MLSVPLNSNANGTNLTQLAYTDNTNYRDEWTVFISKPVSGSEITYNPSLWNYSPVVSRTNCYSYAFNNQIYPGTNDLWAMQPGELAGHYLTQNILTETTVEEYVTEDARILTLLGYTFREIEKHEVCGEGMYKVALVVAPGVDYHWYRQNPDGTWSHKPGGQNVVNTDASGRIIYDPETADREYYYANYSVLVGYYEITPLNNLYMASRLLENTSKMHDTILFEEDKINLPSLSDAQKVIKGMHYSAVTELIGQPQCVRTFGLLVVEYYLANGDVLLVEYTKNVFGHYVVESVQIE